MANIKIWFIEFNGISRKQVTLIIFSIIFIVLIVALLIYFNKIKNVKLNDESDQKQKQVQAINLIMNEYHAAITERNNAQKEKKEIENSYSRDNIQLEFRKDQLQNKVDSLEFVVEQKLNALATVIASRNRLQSITDSILSTHNKETSKLREQLEIKERLLVQKDSAIALLNHFYGEGAASRVSDSKIIFDFTLDSVGYYLSNTKYIVKNGFILYLKVKEVRNNKYITYNESFGMNNIIRAKYFEFDSTKMQFKGNIEFVNTEDRPFSRRDTFVFELYLDTLMRPLIHVPQNLRRSPDIK